MTFGTTHYSRRVRSFQRRRGFFNGNRPFALTRFDAATFADEIRQTFGDGAPFVIDVCDFTCHRANWIILSSGWSTPDETLRRLVQMCEERGLHIYGGLTAR